MPEEFKYQDKKVGKDVNDEGSLQNLVNKEFKKIENKNGIWYRDDQEIRNAWWNICETLINQIKKDKTMVYWPWALQPLTNLANTLKREHNAMKWMKLITNNADKIYQIAQRIDEAERQTLERLQMNRTTQNSRDIVKKSEEKDKKNPMFTMELDNANKETGNIVFTKASNPVKIHTALEWLFDNTDKVYQIDYSKCTNQKIKNKMTTLIWGQTCYLRYDEWQKTYTIRDKYGNWIYDRALIREWVKLIPDWVRKWWAYQEQKKMEENLWKESAENEDNNIKNMLRDMPSAKNLNLNQQKDLFTKTDERILELLKKAKKLGYEIASECITKLYVKKWHMELHLVSGISETNRTVRENDSQLWSSLYNFLDKNESEYKTYLTNRVKQKRQELDSLTKIEATDVEKKSWEQESRNESEDEKEKEQQHKQQVLYGIWLLETMVDNYRESEWNSWADNDDRNLVQIKQLIRNAKASITKANVIDDEIITLNFIDPIRQKWSSIKKISKTINSWQGQAYENPSYKQQYNQLKKVFFWSNNEQIDAIRDLWWFWRFFDKTETSFLQQEIENNSFDEEWENMEVKYTKVNECLQKIYNYKVELSQEAGDFDESWNLSPSWQEKVKELDKLYEKAKLEKSEFANYLSSIWLLPSNWKTKNKMVLKAVESLQNKLNNTKKQLDNFTKTKENLAEEQHIKKLELEQKQNKTEEDLKELQALEYLEQNTEDRDRINEVTLNMMKVELQYWWINQLLWSSLFESLAELGWWAIWNNSEVYNDIIWYWFLNLSDENAKIAWEIATEIAITVAVCVVTWWAGAGAIAAMLNVWSRFASAAKWTKLAKNIEKLVKLTKTFKEANAIWQWLKVVKTASTMGKVALWTTMGTWLLLEGTIFNAAANTIHSAMNGTSLDSLNINPTAKENVQTAAFLGALSISWKLTQSLMKAWWKTKLSIKLMEWLKKAHLQAPAKFTTSLVTEMGSMLAAEQTINFVFWHDIVNPETWEIEKSRKPELPTQQELTQMIGMILAFKMVKPWIWEELTKKLNKWTLEICRSVKPNEILVRNPKTWEIVERINQDSINWNNKESETKSVIEKPIDSPTKDQEAIRKRQQELINKKQSHEKRKSELDKRKAGLERRKSELLAQREANWRSLDWRDNNIWRIQDILKKGNIITIDWLKYKFNGVKNGKAEFIIDGNAKKSAEALWQSYSEKVEVSSLEELLSSHFNLEPWTKRTNSWRYAKLNELIWEKTEPLDRLQNKISNKKAEIKTLEEEIARLEKWKNTVAKNDYFEQHKNEIVGRNVRIDGVEYKAEHINRDGSIQFKQADWNENFAVSSFKQLAEKWQVNWFSDWLLADWSPRKWSEQLTKSESDNHKAIRDLISWESEYLSSRNTDQTLNQKRADLQSAQQELKWLEDKLPASQTRQQAINERARRWEEINKELRKVEWELDWVSRELWESDRLIKKYQDEFEWIEKEILSESMWSDLHEEWRKGRLKEDWTYEPRIKETKDTEWISKNWTNQVDIANTKFEDLPSDWKYENLEAAKVAVDLVYEKMLKWESISPKALEEMSSKVHEERLKRNSWAKWWKLDVPYDKLPEVEKAKDRNQVLQAIETIKWRNFKLETSKFFSELKELYKKKYKELTKEEKSKVLELEKEIQQQGILVARSPIIESTKISMLAKAEPREAFLPDFNNETQLIEVWFHKWEDGKRYHNNREWYPNPLSENDVIYIFKKDANGIPIDTGFWPSHELSTMYVRTEDFDANRIKFIKAQEMTPWKIVSLKKCASGTFCILPVGTKLFTSEGIVEVKPWEIINIKEWQNSVHTSKMSDIPDMYKADPLNPASKQLFDLINEYKIKESKLTDAEKIAFQDRIADTFSRINRWQKLCEILGENEVAPKTLREEYEIASKIAKELDSKYISRIDVSDFNKAIEQAREILKEIYANPDLTPVQKEAAKMAVMIRLLPKTNAHQHLKGSLPKDITLDLAKQKWFTEEQIRAIEESYAKGENWYDNLNEFNDSYGKIWRPVSTPADYEYAIHWIIREAMKQWQLTTEIRCACDSLRNEKWEYLTPEKWAEAIIQAIENVTKEYESQGLTPPKTSFVFLSYRGRDWNGSLESAVTQAKEAVKAATKHPDMKFWFDVAGPEDTWYGPKYFANAIKIIKDYNAKVESWKIQGEKIGITMHAWETPTFDGWRPWYLSVEEAIEMGVDRIGHWVQAITNPETMQKLRDSGITVEICGVCNIQSIPINTEWLLQHPIDKFIDNQIPVTICTDNDAICGTNVSKEYLQFLLTGHSNFMDWNNVKQSARDGIQSAFISKSDKINTTQILEDRINQIQKLVDDFNPQIKGKELQAKRKADEEVKRKADEEAKRKADEEAKRKADEEAK